MRIDEIFKELEGYLTRISLGGSPDSADNALALLPELQKEIQVVVDRASIEAFKEALVAMNEITAEMYNKLGKANGTDQDATSN